MVYAGLQDRAKLRPRGAEIWWIGAGSAITAFSDPEGEWGGMEVKLGRE